MPSPDTLQEIEQACKTAALEHGLAHASEQPFGGYHVVCSGDFVQHQPPTGKPLFFGAAHVPADKMGDWKALEQMGREAWKQFTSCVILKEQHRFPTDTEDGEKLYNMVNVLASEDQPSREACEKLCDSLNARAISQEELNEMLKTRVPRVVLLRNALRQPLNLQLALHQASLAQKRLIMWRCVDTSTTGARLSPELSATLDHVRSGGSEIAAVQAFYPGITYKFVDNEFPQLGRVNNNTCTGVSIVLDPREAAHPDDGAGPCHVLRYMPFAIIVRPHGPELPRLSELRLQGVPAGCIPIVPQRHTFAVQLPEKMRVFEDKDDELSKLRVRRVGVSLDIANAVTDYFSQGMSFKGEPYLLHITPPPTGKLLRANLLVPVSRPSVYSQLRLLAPLWPPGDGAARARVVDRVHRALAVDPHYKAEMNRLRSLAADTLRRADAGV